MRKHFRFILFLFVLAFAALPVHGGINTVVSPEKHNSTYIIPLRIHLGKSAREPQQWLPVFREIKAIWFNQADICFSIEGVLHDQPADNGLDLWFEPSIPEWNGYFVDLHDIHVRDDPILRPAANPAKSAAARTAAHELGHALDLEHRQDSDDNLMRSKTYGWQLHPDEIEQARSGAAQLTTALPTINACPAPRLMNTP